MKKILSIVVLLAFSAHAFAQDLNTYKYALVPSKFSFLKEKDQYRMSTLTKMFLVKYGFETYLDSDILPDDFAKENCNKVYVDLIENNSIMMTKIKVVLKDCKNNILFTSDEGKSRDKEYKVAYNQALREAFNSFDKLNHQYSDSDLFKKSEEQLKEKDVVVAVTPTFNSTNTLSLFAQPISNGFQLINAEPKVIYKILKTSDKDVYIATKESLQGVFIKKDTTWFFEYYKDGKLFSEKVEVTF